MMMMMHGTCNFDVLSNVSARLQGSHALICKLQMEINKGLNFIFLVLFLNLLWCEVK